jgi:UrcA family protein
MKQPTSAFTLAIALLCSGLPAPAAAKTHRIVVVAPPDTVAYQVIYDGLNLATADGAKALYRQVATAVTNLCDEVTDGDQATRAYAIVHSDCENQSWLDARPQITTAIERAREVAASGNPSIAGGAVTISAGR